MLEQFLSTCRFESGTLHGLWPNNCNACPMDYPEHCSNEPFSSDLIPQDVLDKIICMMQQDWPSGVGRKLLVSQIKCMPNMLHDCSAGVPDLGNYASKVCSALC